MKHFSGSMMLRFAASVSAVSLVGVAGASPAFAQSSRVSVPALPMTKALERIKAETGKAIKYDPDAVTEMRSAPVSGATDAAAAVKQAIRGTNLAMTVESDGSILVTNDVLVVAHRDEAETSVLVGQTSTSDRSGLSLREQPRNTQVISSKLISDQQDLTVLDALKNAGGVTINSANVQGGSSFSVRGFSSAGLTNGLASTTESGVPVGTSEPISAIERIEVLKGPDAILAGSDNLGGTVNIVYKKPSADPLLGLQFTTGSFGLVRGEVDVNNAITTDRHLSARLIASASTMSHNFGGYRGNEDYLILPELRFKNAKTDVVVGVATSSTISGLSPYTLINPATLTLYDLPRDQPLISPDQYIKSTNTQVFVNAEQKVTDWFDLVSRFQHIHSTIQLNIYTLLRVRTASGLASISNRQGYQAGKYHGVRCICPVQLQYVWIAASTCGRVQLY